MRAHASDLRAEIENENTTPAAEADQLVHAIASNWRVANLDDSDNALCDFASKLTVAPGKMSESHILELKKHGFHDAAIHDAAQVISYFNYINRIADSLDVDLETEIHAWEQSAPTGSR